MNVDRIVMICCGLALAVLIFSDQWEAAQETPRATDGQVAMPSAANLPASSPTNAAGQSSVADFQTAASKEAVGQREIAPAAPSLDCLRLVRGQWLRAYVNHSGDGKGAYGGTRHECYYGHATTERFVQ